MQARLLVWKIILRHLHGLHRTWCTRYANLCMVQTLPQKGQKRLWGNHNCHNTSWKAARISARIEKYIQLFFVHASQVEHSKPRGPIVRTAVPKVIITTLLLSYSYIWVIHTFWNAILFFPPRILNVQGAEIDPA